MMEKKINLPARYAAMTENEKMDTVGGSAAETAARVAIALSVSGVLVCVAGAAAHNVIDGTIAWGKGFIGASMNWGKNFIQNSMASGEKLLHGLMGISPLN